MRAHGETPKPLQDYGPRAPRAVERVDALRDRHREIGQDRVDWDERDGDTHSAFPSKIGELQDFDPRLWNPNAERLQQLGTVRSDLRGGIDRECPDVAVPDVARVAAADAVHLLVE
jgi:hypothetical protein